MKAPGYLHFICIIILSCLIPANAQNKEWNVQTVNEVGAEPKHTSFYYFADSESAQQNKPSNSPFYKSLNGKDNS